MLNFRLKVFRAVARHLSFRRAAEELYLSQPAVSLQIKTLEEEIGLQLFDRSGGHIRLTPAGETLLRYAEKLGKLAADWKCRWPRTIPNASSRTSPDSASPWA